MNTGKKLLLIASLVLAGTATANAADYHLSAGRWEITEGMSLSANTTPSQTRTICIEDNETRVSERWFIELASPNSACASNVTNLDQAQIEFSLTCPGSNGDMEGPVNVNVSDSYFTISSDLAIQLGGYPLPLRRQLTARQVGQCHQ